MEIEVRGLSAEAAREAIEQAFAEVAEIEGDRRRRAGLAALNAAAGRGPQPVDPRLLAVLTRAASFCEWSERDARPARARPLRRLGAAAARRSRGGARSRSLGAGGGAARPATGWRSIRSTAPPRSPQGAASTSSGSRRGPPWTARSRSCASGRWRNGFVRIGPVRRGFGPGPAGKGWPVALPQLPGAEEPAGEVHLRDRLAGDRRAGRPPAPGRRASYLNQRTGRPGYRGCVAVAASTELALDAQGLATTMLISGPAPGQIRLGSLRPRPSVLWFMGSDGGPPLMVDYRWSDVNREASREPAEVADALVHQVAEQPEAGGREVDRHPDLAPAAVHGGLDQVAGDHHRRQR